MVKRIDTLTAYDEALAEEVSGEPINNIEEADAPKVKIYCALAWVHLKRTETGLTYDEYMKSHKFRDALKYVFAHEPGTEGAEVEGDEADPFPEGEGAESAAEPAEAADAEGPVLSGDGDQPV